MSALCIAAAGSVRPGAPADALDVLARSAEAADTDLTDSADGWLTRLTRLSGAPFCLDLYAQGARGPGWRELDAFALATVYGQVLWDDRMWGWHGEVGFPESAARLRELHDLALRCYRKLDAGERLVLLGD